MHSRTAWALGNVCHRLPPQCNAVALPFPHAARRSGRQIQCWRRALTSVGFALPMVTIPSLDKIWRGERGMRVGIQSCERAKCVVSALTLIYSAVDALAALTRKAQGTRATRKEFLAWVTAYLLPEIGGGLTALDLYGARCGVVHTYGPTSDLSKNGEAKLLIYKWRVGHRPGDPILA